eukprot:10098373-Alexandrium_andersonii.AAC.1
MRCVRALRHVARTASAPAHAARHPRRCLLRYDVQSWNQRDFVGYSAKASGRCKCRMIQVVL